MSETNQEVIYPLKMYMKLGKDKVTAYNGRQVLELYKSFLKEQGEAWFPTNVLVLGIAKQRKKELSKAIEEGQIVEIYFAIGRTYDDSNRIYGKARVLAIETSEEMVVSPEPLFTPREWQIHQAKSWIKIGTFVDWVEVSNEAQDFIVVSSGKGLEYVIQKSQVHFGYIIKK